MKLKYKSKVYDSEDIPLFLYFKTFDSKKQFIDTLVKYNPGTSIIATDVYVAFAGNTIIKDKRSKLYYCIDTREEKNIILKSMYDDGETENNAMVCSPPDIPEESLITWIQNNLHRLK